jgi:AraC-like DNA-binding protein
VLEQGLQVPSHGVRPVWNAVMGLLCATLNSAARHDPTDSAPAKLPHKERIKNFIQQELRNPLLSVTLISQSLGISTRHIHRLYADESGSVMRGIWDARLEQCYREITQEEPCRRPLHDIASDWGFNDQAHFSRLFRERFGASPSQVRNAPRCV